MRIQIIDAFTDRPFAGNPAAVCLLEADRWPAESWMRQVAAEMNLSETAFAHPLAGDTGADWALRWFTPAVEVDLCGHATLATAYALHADGRAAGPVRFRSRSGILVAHAHPDGSITLDFPTAALRETPPLAGLADALGAPVAATYRTGDLGDLLAVLPDEDTVRGLAPDLARVDEVGQRQGFRGVIVTAAAAGEATGTTSGAAAGYDFVSRFFGPSVGIAEDPVTGSAHTALAPYWSARLGRDRLTGRQLSARGGSVQTELRGERVHLTGRAVAVVDGTLHAAPPPS